MVAYNFKPQFAAPILEGVKVSTIRAIGKRRHARPGELLQLYTGQRTKSCRLLMVVPCASVEPVVIQRDGVRMMWAGAWWRPDPARIAFLEGFETWPAMRDWFEAAHGLPTPEMLLISWNSLAAKFAAEGPFAGVSGT